VKALKAGEEITVFEDVMFSPLSLKKLVELIEVVISKRIAGLYNMGSKNGMSKADLAYTLAELLSLPVNTMRRGNSDDLSRVRYRPKDMRMDSSLFERTFNIELPTLDDEIRSLKLSYEE
jgi:dTDP-4-dehydrorhamnose reductase